MFKTKVLRLTVLLLALVLVFVACTDVTTTNPLTSSTTNTPVSNSTNQTTQSPTTTEPTTTLPPVTTEPEEVFVLLNQSSASLKVNQSITLIAEMTDGSVPAFVWNSSNSEVASVVNGVVTALKSGQVTITVTVGELSAECIITVTDVTELIFAEIPTTAFVGESIDLDIVARVNGIDITDNIAITGTGFTVTDGVITLTSSGIISITASFPGTDSITRSLTAYYEIANLEDYLAVNNDLTGYYMMTADIDLAGNPLNTIAHYSAGHSASTSGFNGIFDGNGHTISNFYAYYSTDLNIKANSSPFGLIGTNGIVKNTNFIGVEIKTRIAGGVATVNYGLIENCFAQVHVTYNTNSDANNPMGGLVSKNYGRIANSVAIVTIKDGIFTDNIGGVVGRSLSGSSITNAYSISSVGKYESAVPTNGLMAGEFTNFEGYSTLEAFYESADITSFGSFWNLTEGFFPHLGTLTDTISISNTLTEIYAGNQLEITALSSHKIVFGLKNAIDGVTISQNGLLTISESVPANTIITVTVSSAFADIISEYEITVLENNYVITSDQLTYHFEWTKTISLIDDYSALHGIQVLYNDNLFTEYSLVSTNEAVVIVSGDKIIATGDGSAKINVVIDDVVLYSIDISSVMYQPITTTEEFLAIGTDNQSLAGKYILMNDLDFQGGIIRAFSSYKTKNGASGLAFSGVFDGNGYTIANFTPHHNILDASDRDRAIFGYMTPSAIVKNVNFIGVIGDDRTAVVSNWNEGTIQNIYVEMHYISTINNNRTDTNPAGVVASKNRLGAIIENCITVLSFAEGATPNFLGGVVGSNSGVVTNALTITDNGSINSIYKPYVEGIVTNSVTFSDLATFNGYANTASFPSNWVLTNGFYPHLSNLTDSIEITNPVPKIYVNTSLQISVSSRYGVIYTVLNTEPGITISSSGLLTITSEVAVGTLIIVKVDSHFGVASKTMMFQVVENNFTIEKTVEHFDFTWINGVSSEEAFQSPLGLTIKNNGDIYTGIYDIVISDNNVVKVENGIVIALGDGSAIIEIKVEGQTLTTLTVSSEMYLPIYTTADFISIGANSDNVKKKYMLMNDIDFEGQGMPTIAHYSDGYGSATNGFAGIFDGNGYSISNFYAYYQKDLTIVANSSPFGTVATTGIIRNVNFTKVLIKTRIAAGIATMNYGTIENCFVEVHVTYDTKAADANNPIGGIAAKNYGVIRNTIVVLTADSAISLVNIGGVVGRTYGDSRTENSFAIGPVGIYESAAVSGGMLGVFTNVFAYPTLADFYLGADKTSFNSDWVFAENYYPHLNKLVEVIDITNTSNQVYTEVPYQVQVPNKYTVNYSLVTPVDGVIISNTGLLTIANTVPIGTEITIKVKSLFQNLEDQITLVVSENHFLVTAEQDLYIFEWVLNHSTVDQYSANADLTVTLNGEVFTGPIRFVSDNPSVAIYENGKIIATGNGLARIHVYINDSLLFTFTVDSTLYLPITTTQEFEAIGLNGTTVTQNYRLMNNLDFQGSGLATIAHYSAGYNSNVKGFSGIFDGNGYSISNFYAYYKADLKVVANSSPFGNIALTGVVKNVNFTGVIIKTRIAGGVATTNYGTIENCFVEVHITYHTTSDVNNPMGGIVSKNYGKIINSIAMVSVASGISTVNIGGIAGRTYADSLIQNSFTIGPVGIYESAAVTGGMLGIFTNALSFTSLELFYQNADLTSFNDTWTLEANNYPYYGLINGVFEVTNTSLEIELGKSVQLTTNTPYKVTFALVEPITGVTLTSSGLLTVSPEVAVETTITILASSVFDTSFTDQVIFTVIEPTVE